MKDWLLYVDPSPRGAWALRMASLLPGLGSARLVTLATVEDASAAPDLIARARASLAAAPEVVPRTRPGPAEQALAAEARERAYDLVIVPPAGRGALRRMLQGSRVATVVRSVRAPVLVARRPPERLARVLVGVSGGRLAQAVCEAALGLGLAPDGMAFLHVAAAVPLPFTGPGSRAHAVPDRRDEAEAARDALASAGSRAPLAVREGLVVEELLAEFEAGAYDLLVVGGQAADPGWGVEDVTERLMLGCPGSVLVVPRETAAERA